MLNFNKDHKKFILTISVVFIFLSIVIAVVPAYQMQEKVGPLPLQPPLQENEVRGLQVYVAENCMACHTQQVRNIEMDKLWGERPSIPSDYYYSKQRMDVFRQSPSLLGSERTGPDLTNIGKRQPGSEWHLLHLYNPRIVVKESIMPGYPWLFKEKAEESLNENDVVVPVPTQYLQNRNNKIVATQKALDLVAYLQSLKQMPLPKPTTVPFIPSENSKVGDKTSNAAALPDGATLYAQTCAACHQSNGSGLPGAFPALAGSKIVNDDNYELLIKIILQGYDARAEYGKMPAFAEQLSDEQIAAIANHERNSWGNKASSITAEDVKRIREYVNTLNQ
ncbi:MAG TPA: cbb3-type cytochrome c oxidase subunit II [Cytophagaceae bacterium]